jgi:hypothetical protein
MVFVLLADENTLVAHDDELEAVRACEGIDVEDCICLFFGGKGEPLRPVFDEPNERGRFVVTSGRYHLAPDQGNRRNLLECCRALQISRGKGRCAHCKTSGAF